MSLAVVSRFAVKKLASILCRLVPMCGGKIVSDISRYVGFSFSLAFIILTSHYVVALGPSSSGVYFVIGMSVSGRVLEHKAGDKSRSALAGIGFMLLSGVLRIVWFRSGHDFFHGGGTLLANISVVLLLAGIWYLTDLMPLRLVGHGIVQTVLPLTAFVYFMHYPINDFVKQSLPIVNPDCLFVTLCICAPVSYLLLAWTIHKYLKGIYAVLSGGR